MSSRPPNILVLTAHDIGRHLGCYGVPEAGTDRIDALASDGIRFARFHSAAPQCSPARASLFTGRWPHSNGVLGICSPVFGFDLSPGESHLAGQLRDFGYATGALGAVHETLHPDRLPFDRLGPPHGDASEMAAGAGSLIGELGEPFYIQVGFREAHRPFERSSYAERGVHIPAWLADEPSAREELARFQASLRSLDTGVGRILDTLQQRDLAERTWVWLLADHGIPFPRAKHSLYEPGCAAAAVCRWPAGGWAGGRTFGQLLSGVDLLPTICDVLGMPVPGGVQGRSFKAVAAGGAYAAKTAVFTEQSFNAWTDVSRAVRTERHKLIANFSPGRGFSDPSQTWRPGTRVAFLENATRTYHPPLELYDLERDPLEKTNLADDPQAALALAETGRLLHDWMRETGDPLLESPPVPPIHRWALDALRQLGSDGAGTPAGRNPGRGAATKENP